MSRYTTKDFSTKIGVWDDIKKDFVKSDIGRKRLFFKPSAAEKLAAQLNAEEQQPEAAAITLEIQLVSKPEMSVGEATKIISDNFPQDKEPIPGVTNLKFVSSNSTTGIVSLKLPNQEKLTDEQTDWLHLSHFAARYVDFYKVK